MLYPTQQCAGKLGGISRAQRAGKKCVFKLMDELGETKKMREKHDAFQFMPNEMVRIRRLLSRKDPVGEFTTLLLKARFPKLLNMDYDLSENICVCPELLRKNSEGQFEVPQTLTFETENEAIEQVIKNLERD